MRRWPTAPLELTLCAVYYLKWNKKKKSFKQTKEPIHSSNNSTPCQRLYCARVDINMYTNTKQIRVIFLGLF